MSDDELRHALCNSVNSAMLTYENHDTDNGFLSYSLKEMKRGLVRRGYEPVGISRNVPYNKYPTPQVAFVYKYMDEVYWCHMPVMCLTRCIEQLK
ncbi:MAG: hypothetical protein ACI4E1_03360 [Lachnospira sp.]